MSTASIRDLALKFGAMETISSSSKPRTNRCRRKPQEFHYLVVLDFEATCWSAKPTRKMQNEIIEFSGVLLHVEQAKIVDHFQMYVKPSEYPELSEFCTQLTGIEQSTVDKAAHLDDVLVAFDEWIRNMRRMYDFKFVGCDQEYDFGGESLCAFATWSDWDLGTCLKKECKRKRLRKNEYFNQWIDVRITYMELYKEKPMGLLGALQSQGMDFVGVEHCGLDDARNTAYLINTMVSDGVRLSVTKIL